MRGSSSSLHLSRSAAASLAVLLLVSSSIGSSLVESAVIISEVADKGSRYACDGNDWIELHNSGADVVSLDGYTLHDDRGPSGIESFFFGGNGGAETISPGDYLLVCNLPFGIGGRDQVTLRDPEGIVESSTGGSLTDGGASGITLAWEESTGSYLYTRTPTPGEANVVTAPLTPEEVQSQLVAQNEVGTQFFNMDLYGMPVDGGMPDVLDLHVTVDDVSLAKLTGPERAYETYSPFEGAVLTAMDDKSNVLANMTSSGRIRPKGQSTMYLGVCMNRTTPYQLDWDYTDPNQRFFGMEKTYLRTAYSDPSFSREWASHRMLARFGLPHLRTRKVRFFFNDQYMGLYNLMEAVDQEYVFKRSFPDYDPENYGIYKVKTQSIDCGRYGEESLAKARARVNETDGPYVFERGEHRPLIPPLNDELQCFGPFINNIAVLEQQDIHLAYVRSGEGDCGEFLVDMGLVDRDLGPKELDEKAAAFIDAHLAANSCDDAQCSNSVLPDFVDVTQILRNLATQAVILHGDSPLGNGNNYYMAYSGSGRWSMAQYDHNNVMSQTSAVLCDGACMLSMINWSMLRPTCRSIKDNQWAGPMLSNDARRAEYVEHVRDFVDNVLTDDFIEVIENHMEAIKDLVPVDPWSDYAPLYDGYELADGEEWFQMIDGGPFGELPYVPFLSALRARITSVKEQLKAIDEDAFPRSIGEYNPGEACVDWTTESPPDFPCPNNCFYDGCGGENFLARPFCDPESQMCFVGQLAFECFGIPSGDPYPGDESGTSFCVTADGFPAKASLCPLYEGGAEDTDAFDNGSAGIMGDGADTTSAAGNTYQLASIFSAMAASIGVLLASHEI